MFKMGASTPLGPTVGFFFWRDILLRRCKIGNGEHEVNWNLNNSTFWLHLIIKLEISFLVIAFQRQQPPDYGKGRIIIPLVSRPSTGNNCRVSAMTGNTNKIIKIGTGVNSILPPESV